MTITTTVEKLIHGGFGLARTANGTVFVSDVCEGETVEAEITSMKARTLFGRPVKILSPSPHRRTPPCPLAGTCGGCNWQHIAYDVQVEYKKRIFRECMARIGKIGAVPGPEVLCAGEWRYRHRVQLKLDHADMHLGLFERKTNRVIRIDHCPLLAGPLDRILAGQDRIVPLIRSGSSQIKAISGTDGTVASVPGIAGWTERQAVIETGGMRFRVDGDAFFQSNVFLLEPLGTWILKYAAGEVFLDLYGGTGFFSAFLSGKFNRGILVESDFRCVENARDSFRLNGISNTSVVNATVERFLSSGIPVRFNHCCVIVDPPRPGLTPAVRELLMKARPETLIYISCNPSTQARDIGFFHHECGYAIFKTALFDLYPQTHHVESIVVLNRG
jgi:23S rRNA (uracil1939-C5)-methyltransferase